MQSHLRRQEVREDVINDLIKEYGYSHIRLEQYDGTEEETFLEGTGSIVFDHNLKRAYAALSPRTDRELLGRLCGRIGYEPIIFSATDNSGRQVYHTNVILTIGESFAVICADMIRDENEKVGVIKKLGEGGREIILINEKQVSKFAGNMIQLRSKDGKKVLVMTISAFDSLEKDQREKLQRHNDNIVTANINTIETIGGGSARCMIAEIFHQ